jgi:hypothetical protein
MLTYADVCLLETENAQVFATGSFKRVYRYMRDAVYACNSCNRAATELQQSCNYATAAAGTCVMLYM